MSELSEHQYSEIGRFLVRHLRNGATIKPGSNAELFVPSCDKVINCGLVIIYPDGDIANPKTPDV